MSNVLEIPDAGTVTVRAGGAEVALDAYRVWNLVCEAQEKNADADGTLRQFHDAVADALVAEGLPRLSHFQVDRFVAQLGEAVDALGKGAAGTPASPASTVPAS